MTKKRPSHEEFKKSLLADPKVAELYDDLEEEYQLLREMISARKRLNMTQAKVAKVMGTTTSAVSRLESLHLKNRPSPSLTTLKKYAHALGCRLSIKLKPLKCAS